MNEQSLFSGLGQEAYRASFGGSLWESIVGNWREPGTVLAGDPAAIPGDATIHWLYQSPAHAVLSAPVGQAASTVLERWVTDARAILNVRRHWRSRLVLVCADDLDAAALAALAGVDAPVAAEPSAAIPDGLARFAPVLKTLLHQELPALGELYSLMQAASRPVDAEEPGTEGQFTQVLDALKSGWLAEARTLELEAQTAELQANFSTATSEQARIRSLLNSVVDVQEALEQRTRELAEAQARSDAQQAEAHSLREQVATAGGELARVREQLAKLQAAQAAAVGEIDGIRATRDRLLATLIETQESLERSAVGSFTAQQAAEKEISALRTQLQYMQGELATRSQALVPLPPKSSMPQRVARRLSGLVHPGRTAIERATRERSTIVVELRGARWFDGAWYLAQYPDVADAQVDPAEHYLDHGAAEGRDPGPNFSTRHYLAAYPDVSESGMNPLLHFIRHGLPEGRLPCKL